MSTPLEVYHHHQRCQASSCNVHGVSIKCRHSRGYGAHDATVGKSNGKAKKVKAAKGWGARIAWLQGCSRLNQQKFGAAIGVGADMVSRWIHERLKYGPHASSLEGIVDFYKIPRRHWIIDFVLKNKYRKELEEFFEQMDSGSPTVAVDGNGQHSPDFVKTMADIGQQIAKACERERTRGSPARVNPAKI